MVADLVKVRLTNNSTQVPEDEGIGAYIILHPQETVPVVSDHNTFVADITKQTFAHLKSIKTTYLNGTEGGSYEVSTVSSVTIQDTQPDAAFAVEVVLSFGQQGIYYAQEYYYYTIYNWFGEVGGFSCLMIFLHRAVLWIAVQLAKRCGRPFSTI